MNHSSGTSSRSGQIGMCGDPSVLKTMRTEEISATAPAGGTCGTKPCWSVIPAKKIKYTSKALTPDGLQKMQLQAGDPGKGKIQVKGKGANLGVPTLGLATPVTVRLVRSGGAACWEATYDTNVLLNTSEKFKAKSD